MEKFIIIISICLITLPRHSESTCQKCPPGTKRLLPCSTDHVSNCVNCEPGEFNQYDTRSISCRTCTTSCDVLHQTIVSPCTPTSDSVCQCKKDYWIMSRFDIACQQHTHCPPGSGVSIHGTPSSDVQCEICPHGTFSPLISSTQTCLPHTSCAQLGGVKQLGNSTHDNICQSEPGLSPTWMAVIGGISGIVLIILIIICVCCKRKCHCLSKLSKKFSGTHKKSLTGGTMLNDLAGDGNIQPNQFLSQHSTMNNFQSLDEIQHTNSTNHDFNRYNGEEKFINKSISDIREQNFSGPTNFNRGESVEDLNDDNIELLITQRTETPPSYNERTTLPPTFGAVPDK